MFRRRRCWNQFETSACAKERENNKHAIGPSNYQLLTNLPIVNFCFVSHNIKFGLL